MKFSTILLPALSALAAAAPAPSRRAGMTVQSLVSDLTTQVKTITAHMNSTLSTLPAEADTALRSATVSSVVADIKQITAAVSSVTGQIGTLTGASLSSSAASSSSKPTLGDLPADVLGQLDGTPVDVAQLVLPLLQELDPALQSALTTLSLGELYIALQPLLSTELPALVSTLSGLVTGLLASLSPLLAGVGSLLGPILLGLSL